MGFFLKIFPLPLTLVILTGCGQTDGIPVNSVQITTNSKSRESAESPPARFGAAAPMQPLCVVNKQRGYNDVWGLTKAGRHYAFLGAKDRAVVVDITDAKAGTCTELGVYPHRASNWSDLKSYKGYLYVATEGGGGLQIIDIRDLPGPPKEVTKYKGAGFNTSHNIYIDEPNGILYAEGEDNKAVRIIDINTPESPTEIAVLPGSYNHDVFVRDGVLFTSDGLKLSIGLWNVTDPANPQKLGTIPIKNAGYVHNAWSTEDNSHVMTTEEQRDKTVKMWKLLGSPPSRGTLVAEYLAPKAEDKGQMAHNTHIMGDYAYLSHYQGGGRILDIRSPAKMKEVAFVAGPDGLRGKGYDMWGSFPFYKGVDFVAWSDKTLGLVVTEFSPQ